MSKKRYAQVGLGDRARMYYNAITTTYKDTSELVALCDVNQSRMDYANSKVAENGAQKVPTYIYADFDRMIAETKPDVLIITSMDRTHHKYAIRAMELGVDVITEKPMTVDAEKAQAVVDCAKRTGRKLRVTFNYRYAPLATKTREVIRDGLIGDVTSVHFEWLLNTLHGADYFRRWHRDKRNSGGLLVHKATHHFDLVNFWLDSSPETVFAMGGLYFYGRENAENRGVTKFYSRAHGSPNAEGDHFAYNIEKRDDHKAIYLNAEHEDGYYRDQSVFGDGINIEDTMGVMVKYKNKAIMTYSLNAYLPWEGYRVCFNGTKGRLQVTLVERSYFAGDGSNKSAGEGVREGKTITLFPMFGEPYEVPVEEGVGGHGGGDRVMLDDIFLENPPADEFKRSAGVREGAMSILTGIAANKSIATGLPVQIDSLIKL